MNNKMGIVETRLLELGIVLDPPKPVVANYLGTKQIGDLLFVSGRKSELMGEVGKNISVDQAKDAARETILAMLSIIKADIGDLDKISGVVKLQGFVRSARNFTSQPMVIDGASDMLIEIFGEQGRHARTATGVHQLPYGAVVQLDIILQMKPVNF